MKNEPVYLPAAAGQVAMCIDSFTADVRRWTQEELKACVLLMPVLGWRCHHQEDDNQYMEPLFPQLPEGRVAEYALQLPDGRYLTKLGGLLDEDSARDYFVDRIKEISREYGATTRRSE